MRFTIESLAKLGRERTISSLFERVWQPGRGSNPVTMAMQIVENKRRSRNRSLLHLVMLGLLVSLGFAVWSVLVNERDIGSTVAHVTQIAFLSFALLMALMALEEKMQEMGNSAEANLNYFCEQLSLVEDWLVMGEERFYLYRDEDEIRKVGADILIRAVKKVLREEQCEKEAQTKELKERHQVYAGNERAEFTRRYNTLQQIGMASGGYDKYFDSAKQQMAEAKSVA